VTHAIRTEEVSEAAAHISQYPGVRAAMVRRQRELAEARGVVVEGRDTGSVVFPEAPYKFFLTASPLVRAKRRQSELAKRYGSKPPLAQIQEQLHFRDQLDRTRRVGALVKPTGALVIKTSDRTAHQVVQAMRRHILSTGTACQPDPSTTRR
jgi:cytidylate kinase